ncbi:MAG: DUF928 domain-containing protein [Cyanobacteria bacterium J06642_2]
MSVFALLKQVTRWCVVLGTAASIVLSGSMIRAQSVPPATSQEQVPELNKQSTQAVFVPPPLPPEHGMPSGRRVGGASRGCRGYELITALVPDLDGHVWGRSASARPSFWFYIPDVGNTGLPLEFVLQDEADRYIFRTEFTLKPGPADVLGVTVPEVALPLEPDRLYRWTLSISVQCAPKEEPNILFARGSVWHVAATPDLRARLKSASPLERASIYAGSGYWYDALTELGQLRHSDPNNFVYADSWERLLRQADIMYPEADRIAPRWAFIPSSSPTN